MQLNKRESSLTKASAAANDGPSELGSRYAHPTRDSTPGPGDRIALVEERQLNEDDDVSTAPATSVTCQSSEHEVGVTQAGSDWTDTARYSLEGASEPGLKAVEHRCQLVDTDDLRTVAGHSQAPRSRATAIATTDQTVKCGFQDEAMRFIDNMASDGLFDDDLEESSCAVGLLFWAILLAVIVGVNGTH